MERGYARTMRHGQIHYTSKGSGDTILLLHQSPTSSVEFALVVPILAKKCRAIAMDRIGYGDSDKPPRLYEMSDYVQCIADFLDALGIKKANLLGCAIGAAEAAEFAAIYPERVNRLILSGYPQISQQLLELRRKEVPYTCREVEPGIPKEDGSHMIAAWNYAKRYLGPGASLEHVHEIAMAMLHSGPRNLESHLALWHYLEGGNAQRRLGLIKCPTLFIASAKIYLMKDPDFWGFPIPESEKVNYPVLTNLVPRSKRIVIEEGTTFYLPRVAPELFAQIAMDFIENPGV